ncbi:DUF2057 domain-containing protein [Enterovibrio norvegicus]|nr:hypothetical protein BCU47_10960 [Enterovibrio norvegicus]TKF08934.1 DUF2057 domain-containing protein [Enterovibrio norvegicus]TKF34577.1 DUF2057 domain-containing protein [Enterovibrio norvegicus]
MKKILLGSSLFLFCSPALSAQLEVGPDLQAKVLNGKELEADSGDTVELVDGDNQIIVRYKSILDDGSKTKFFESKPYVFEFKSLGQDLTISVERFRKYKQAEKAFDNGKTRWTIEKPSGVSIPFRFDELPGNPGFLPYADLPKAVAAYNKKNGIYFEGQEIKDINQEVIVAVSDTGEVEITGDPITQLKLWYTKATKEERKTFRKWMIDQE